MINPWGEVISDAGPDEIGVTLADIDTEQIAEARGRIPALQHDRVYRSGAAEAGLETAAE